MALYFNQDEPMPAQLNDWTCSACSLAWLNRALAIDHATDEMSAVDYIGCPDNINQDYGLMDGSGAVLAQRLLEQGAPAFCLWPSYDQVYELTRFMPMLLGGVAWNHWVGVRAQLPSGLAIANSAPGWMGIGDVLLREDWDTHGPFAAVVVPLWRKLPPV
jgi:hypothetical protein